MKKISYSVAVLIGLSGCFSLYADTKLDTVDIIATQYDDSIAGFDSHAMLLTSEEIKKKGFVTLKEALNSMPNIYISTNRNGEESIDMRGWGEKANARIKVVVDGISLNTVDPGYISPSISLINIEDVEYIEVIPGGGSVVYGDKTSGGVVNIVTKSSLSKKYTNAYVKKGSFNHTSFGFSTGEALGQKLYANIGFNVVNEEGYQHFTFKESVNTNFGLKYAPDENQNLGINFDILSANTRMGNLLTKEDMKKDRRSGGFDMYGRSIENSPSKDTIVKNVSIKYKNNITDNISLSIMSFYNHQSKDNNQGDGLIKNTRSGINVKSDLVFGKFKTYIGYEYYRDMGTRNSFGVHKSRLDSNAIYLFENINLSDMFDIDFGARYQNQSYKTTRTTEDLPAYGMVKGKFKDNRKEDAIAANVTLSAWINDESKVYAKIERGFALPGAFEATDKYEDDTHTSPVYHSNGIKQEKFMNYELGFNGRALGQDIILSLFYTDTQDEIFQNMAYGFPAKWWFYNIKQTERYGAELTLRQAFFDEMLEFEENIGYISATAKKGSSSPLKGAKDGEKIPGVSPFSANVSAGYNLDSWLKLRADYSYFSKAKWKFEKDLDSNIEDKKKKGKVLHKDNDKKAYGVLNLGFTYSPNKYLSLNFDAKNVLGEEYELYCDGHGSCLPAPKQSFYAEFRYKY